MNYNNKYILLLSLFLLLLSCKEKSAETETERVMDTSLISLSKSQFEQNKMTLGSLEDRAFNPTLEVSGLIDVPPENRAIVSVLQGGFLKNMTLIIGDRVQKGQYLASLESQEFLKLQQEYLETQAELPELLAAYQRQKTLLEEEISSEKVFLQAQSALRRAEAQLLGLKQQLQLLGIPLPGPGSQGLSAMSPLRAPIAGTITRVAAQNGAFIAPASEIFEIVNTDHLHLELKVYEKDIASLKVGQSLTFRVPELSDMEFDGSIYRIGSTIGADRAIQVHAHMEEETNNNFMVGMYIRSRINLENTSSDSEFLAIPESALIEEGEEKFVLLLEEQSPDSYQFRKIRVRSGMQQEGWIALENNPTLKAGDQILASGAFMVAGLATAAE